MISDGLTKPKTASDHEVFRNMCGLRLPDNVSKERTVNTGDPTQGLHTRALLLHDSTLPTYGPTHDLAYPMVKEKARESSNSFDDVANDP